MTYVSSCFCSVHRVSIVVSIVRPPSVHRCVRRRVVSSWPSDVFVLMAGLLRVVLFRLTSRRLHTASVGTQAVPLGAAGSITSYRAAPEVSGAPKKWFTYLILFGECQSNLGQFEMCARIWTWLFVARCARLKTNLLEQTFKNSLQLQGVYVQRIAGHPVVGLQKTIAQFETAKPPNSQIPNKNGRSVDYAPHCTVGDIID